MDKRMTIEGSGASQLVQLMRQYGHNRDMTIEVATVIAPPPNILIRMPKDGLVLDADDLIIAEHLTEHTRTVSISGGSASGSVSPSGSLTSFAVTDATMTIKGALNAGDKVIVIGDDDSMKYFVIDKAVI